MRKLLQKIIICALFITVLLPAMQAQIFPTRQYTTADELANSDIYDICHDGRGYLWFATERGVSRFDGFKFQNYLFHEGLEGSIVYALAKSDSGEIYAATKYNGIYRFGNNFHKVADADKRLGNEQISICGDYLFSLKTNSAIGIFNLKTKEISLVKFPAENILPLFICKKDAGSILVGTNKGIFICAGKNESAKELIKLDVQINCISSRDNAIYAGGDGVIYRIENSGISEIRLPESGTVRRIMADKSGNIWASTFPGNNIYFIQGEKITEISHKLDTRGCSVNQLLQDNEGNIWIGCYGKGAYCIHHLYCTNFNAGDGLEKEYITALETDQNGSLVIGTFDGIFYFDGNKIVKGKEFPESLNYIRDLHTGNNQMFADIAGISDTSRVAGVEEIASANSIFLKVASSFVENNTVYYNQWDGKLWQATLNNNKLIDRHVIFYDSSAQWNRVNKIFRDKQNKLWLGTTAGLYYGEEGKTWTKLDTGFFSTNISDFIYDHDGNFWVASDKGIARYRSGTWKIFNGIKGKNIENVTSLAVDNNGKLWIGTLAGLFVLDKKNMIEFNTRNVLPNPEINALKFDAKRNALWVGTTAGLSRIDIAGYEHAPMIAPEVVFRNLRTTDSIYRDLDYKQELFLPHSSSNFTLRFSAVYFSAPEGIRFLYKFDDDDWQAATGRMIEFASLNYGKHVIKIKSIGEQDIEGPVSSLILNVETPFWATQWFKISVIVMLILIAYFILRLRFEAVRKKEQERLELQAKISELRHQALAASMNPHFIFNALNSIQHFINVHNTEEATDYLGKFARLIRMMLDSGGKTYIPLREELERLNYYLQLEKVRFGKKLTFSINVDEQLKNDNIEIPNMVIQPIVENALWHGILPAKEDGTLSVQFKKVESSIVVEIDDNGVGINESRKKRKPGHNSVGIQMIRERLELLNKLNGYMADIQIIDKSELDALKHGTLVRIRLNY